MDGLNKHLTLTQETLILTQKLTVSYFNLHMLKVKLH